MRLVLVLVPALVAATAVAQPDTAWVRYCHGDWDAADGADALALDALGRAYVTGFLDWYNWPGWWYTVKYSKEGDTLWAKWGPNGVGADVAVDGSGCAIVTGWCWPPAPIDYYTIKYDTAGAELWENRYNGPANERDEAVAVAVDGAGNAYVTGTSYNTIITADFCTIKYGPGGETLWVRRYEGPGHGLNQAQAIAVDAAGNVFVTGSSEGPSTTGYDYCTIKYGPAGDTAWIRRYNGPGDQNDRATSLAVDGSGNVCVTGQSAGLGKGDDYCTVKYDSGGTRQWVRFYDGPGHGVDQAQAIAVDAAGNVFVTGSSEGPSTTGYDFCTIKYGPAGDTMWIRRYDGPGGLSDGAHALAVDESGNVYVTGQSAGSGWGSDFCTVKYGPTGETLWVHRYDGPLSGHDSPADIAVDDQLDVFLAGVSYDGGLTTAFCTMKLVQHGETAVRRTEGSSVEPGLPTILKAPALVRLDCRVLDALGRDVTDRKARLSPGVYFLRELDRPAAGRKVVVTR